jgi:uncharacterized protein
LLAARWMPLPAELTSRPMPRMVLQAETANAISKAPKAVKISFFMKPSFKVVSSYHIPGAVASISFGWLRAGWGLVSFIPVKPFILSPLLLIASNVFMTFAWYGHLRNFSNRPWIVAAVVSWLIAGFEYLFQVPANRIGATAMTLPQLKIMQEVISLTVFMPFAVFYMQTPLKMDYFYAALCIAGAVYFIFRG